jgi:hypothetical protein
MPTPADRLNENDPQTWRRPKKSHHTPSTSKRHVLSNTFKKECDDSAAAARTSSRVSSVHKGGGEGGTPEALQDGIAAPAGITASVPEKKTWISPDTQKNHHPGRSVVLLPTCRSPACATPILVSSSSSHRAHQHEA